VGGARAPGEARAGDAAASAARRATAIFATRAAADLDSKPSVYDLPKTELGEKKKKKNCEILINFVVARRSRFTAQA
jgi:hypothetical protein